MCGLGDLREHNEISPTTDDPRKHPTTPPSPTISPTPSISSLCGSHTHPPDTMMVTPTLHPPCHHPHLMPSWTDPDGRTDPDGPGRTRTGRTDPDGPGRTQTDGRTDGLGRMDGRTDGRTHQPTKLHYKDKVHPVDDCLGSSDANLRKAPGSPSTLRAGYPTVRSGSNLRAGDPMRGMVCLCGSDPMDTACTPPRPTPFHPRDRRSL